MDNEIVTSLVPLGIGFVIYFALHSLLASLWVKNFVAKHWPTMMPAYRLAFNVLSVVLLAPLLWITQHNPGPLIWQWQGGWSVFMNGLTLAAIGGFIWSLKSYDNKVFLGWTQWKNRHHGINDPEQMHISTLHRFVRHPWYFFILVILWTQNMHLANLVTYSLISLYLIIGSRLEERKLIEFYGEAYRQYCKCVSGLIPLPWRWLSENEAVELAQMAKKHKRQGQDGKQVK